MVDDSRSDDVAPGRLRVSRRRLLQAAGASGLLSTLPQLLGAPARSAALPTARWSDPRSWGGKVPGRRDVAVISKPLLLDIDTRVAGVVVKPTGRLVFDPRRSRTLRSSGNVVVKGALVMRPERAAVQHALTFVDVDEGRFAGGGHEVLKSDVGLWVMHHGRVELVGTAKRAWTRAVGSVPAGSSTILVVDDPIGWRAGDEVVLSPTTSPRDGAHHSAFYRGQISHVDGRTITLDAPVPDDHPAVTVAPGVTLTAEVLNVTRNVRIAGTPGGRAHLFVHSQHAQTLRYASLRHVGPRKRSLSGAASTGVLGRYGVHFHHSYDGSRGSVVEGVVVRDCGNHSFVPHTSHGVRFKDCIAYDVLESPYWWDEGDRTDDILWERSVAALVRFDNEPSALDLTGFFLGRGQNNTVRGCVATGIHGLGTASGFEWPPAPADGLWIFEDCLAHNNQVDGIFVWQINDRPSVVSDFIGYHNGKAGIEHGSFLNAFLYSGAILYGNAAAQLMLHANSDGTPGGGNLSFEDQLMDGAGISPVNVVVNKHIEEPVEPVSFLRCTLKGHTGAAVRISEGGGSAPGWEDFVATSVGNTGRDLESSDFEIVHMLSGSRVRVQRQDGQSAYQFQPPSFEPTPIPPFA